GAVGQAEPAALALAGADGGAGGDGLLRRGGGARPAGEVAGAGLAGLAGGALGGAGVLLLDARHAPGPGRAAGGEGPAGEDRHGGDGDGEAGGSTGGGAEGSRGAHDGSS